MGWGRGRRLECSGLGWDRDGVSRWNHCRVAPIDAGTRTTHGSSVPSEEHHSLFGSLSTILKMKDLGLLLIQLSHFKTPYPMSFYAA